MKQKLGVILADKGLHIKAVSQSTGLAWETVNKAKHRIPDEITVGTLRKIASAIPGVTLVIGFCDNESGE